MPLSPVETLNVFDPPVRNTLRQRAFNKNLITTRAPFLRFTTAVDMATIENIDALGPAFQPYKAGKFFTLGLHGWDNKNYAALDLYGTKTDKGLVVGTTYVSGQQILVHTHSGQQKQTTTQTGFNQFNIDVTDGESARNYPPPGITGAKVERLRNGNVLKFSLEIECHTQEQLQVLDALCFIPGMTCVLEWGTQYTTTSGIKPLVKTLNFKDTNQATQDIQISFADSRSNFIKKWCQPNDFNYDWAVANIANVKTVLDDNRYKVTVIAYGRADNLMYISAYATSNPLDPSRVNADQNIAKAVTEYFRMNGPFSTFLKDNVNNSAGDILKFYDSATQREQPSSVPAATDTGTSNDLGFEDTYFISFTYFIDRILNNAVTNIVNESLDRKISRLITPLLDGSDVVKTGYNEYLRSTNPETMIIFNNAAIEKAKGRTSNSSQQSALIAAVNGNKSNKVSTSGDNIIGPGTLPPEAQTSVYDVMKSRSFGSTINTPSGTTSLLAGVWLNSKGIQQVFMNARTIMEGLEALLRNINAATENYWDLKLFYDEEKQEFRILDDNVREPLVGPQDEIYEFNKKLDTASPPGSTTTDVLGPDVLDITVSSDYPKMLFSQLAISGINGGYLSGTPQRRDAEFVNKKGLRDIFSVNKQPAPRTGGTSSDGQRSQTETMAVQQLSAALSTALLNNNNGIGNISGILSPTFGVGSTTGVPARVSQFITQIFQNKNPVTPEQARLYRTELEQFRRDSLITQEQSASITALLAYRAECIIRGYKTREKEAFETRLRDIVKNLNLEGVDYFATNGLLDTVKAKINESEAALIARIRGSASSAQQQLTAVQQQAEQQNKAAAQARSLERLGSRPGT